MEYDISITPEQAKAIGEWAEDGETMARILIRGFGYDGTIHIGQGDSRAKITTDGYVLEED